MPLSMLLTESLSVVIGQVKELAPWQGLTDRFTLVANRLRSAYLVAWFGSRLPVRGIELRVAIVNIDELRRRWLAIGAGRRRTPTATGPNLTEPLLGMGGAIAGMLAAPVNSALLTAILGRHVEGLWAELGVALSWLSGGLPLTALMMLAPVAVVAGLPALALGGHATEAHDLLGAGAELIGSLRRLWGQLTGPREAVANPLLRQLLTLADRFAALLAQVLGAVAVVVTRLLPLLPSLRDAAIATILAVQELGGAISLVIDDTIAAVSLLWTGTTSVPGVLRAVMGMVDRLITTIGDRLGQWWKEARRLLTARLPMAAMAIGGWLMATASFVRSVLVQHPTVAWFRSFLASAATFSAWRTRTSPPTPSPSTPSTPSAPSTLPAPVRRLLLATGMPPALPRLRTPGPLPDLVPLEDIAPLAGALRRFGVPGPDPFALDPARRAALDRFRRPPSVFGSQRAELGKRAEEPAAVVRTMALADALGRIEPFVTRSANLVVPQYAGAFLPSLEAKLAEIDAAIRPRPPDKSGRPAPHPTALLEEPAEIRPVIGRLRVRRADTEDARPALEEFVTGLRRQLDLAPYRAPAAV